MSRHVYSLLLNIEDILSEEENVVSFLKSFYKNRDFELNIVGLNGSTNKFVKKYDYMINKSYKNGDIINYNFFVINNGDKCGWRYKYEGNILDGLEYYKNIYKQIKRIDKKNENRNR